MRVKKNNFGLTLVELLVVISIIVALALLTIVYLRSQIFKGNDARRKGDIHRISAAVEEYEKDFNCYPLPSLTTCNPGDGLKPYLNKISCDPTTDGSYLYDHEDDVCPVWYRLYAKLEYSTLSCGPGGEFNFYSGSANAPLDPGCPPGEDGGGVPGGGGPPASPPPGGGGESDFFGCFSGACFPISWPPPQCEPSFGDSNCYAQCIGPGGEPQFECTPIN